MTTPLPRLLDLPTSVAAAETARECLDDATAALGRLSDRRDSEALHDFRVGIRRLRSQLRAYRPWLGAAAARKIRRRLRELGAATNPGRDSEIQLAWLELARPSLSRNERSGLNWAIRRLRALRRASYTSARRQVREEFAGIAQSIAERLRDVSFDTPPLAQTVATLLRGHSTDLESRLAVIRSAADKKAVHESRIRAKRLRYLLEPLRRESSAAKRLVRTFKTLQDLLGDLHDVHVLELMLESALDEVSREKSGRLRELALAGEREAFQRERRRDERLGLVALAARARLRRGELFHELERSWLGQCATDLLREVRSFSDSLVPLPAASGPPMERERKYLLSGLPDFVRSAPATEIEQGWLPGTTLRERLRRSESADGVRFFRTVKLGSGIERIEIEEETSQEVFRAMWPLTEGCRIAKRRYKVPVGERVWEIDVFRDRELVMAEVELESADQELRLPDWLSPLVVREVTEEPAYLNLSLATQAA